MNQHVLFLDDENPSIALKRFVVEYAKQILPNLLQQVSQETGLEYRSSQVRYAKSRWGSCSTQQKVMLNAALVLLPEAIARYVCVHELAHTVHFNHSAAFWSVVALYDPQYAQHRHELKRFHWPLWWLES